MLHRVLSKQVATICSTDALTIWTQECIAESIQTTKENIDLASMKTSLDIDVPAQVAAICSTDALTVQTDQQTKE